MSGIGMAVVDLPLGTSPRTSVLVTAPTVTLAVRASGVPVLSRTSRARWRNGWFGAAFGKSGGGSMLWMVICAAALAGQSRQSKAAITHKTARKFIGRLRAAGCVCFMPRECTVARALFKPGARLPSGSGMSRAGPQLRGGVGPDAPVFTPQPARDAARAASLMPPYCARIVTMVLRRDFEGTSMDLRRNTGELRCLCSEDITHAASEHKQRNSPVFL